MVLTKFLKKSIQSFKSLFKSNNISYQKLPKNPNNNSTYLTSPSSPSYHHDQDHHQHQSSLHNQFESKQRTSLIKNIAPIQQPRHRHQTFCSKPKVEIVHRKLKEMEKMMDDDIIRDEDHVSDVREFLHCYSRLRCDAYLDVVEQFFMEVYSDIFTPKSLEPNRTSNMVGVGSCQGRRHR